jgi:serine protease Do
MFKRRILAAAVAGAAIATLSATLIPDQSTAQAAGAASSPIGTVAYGLPDFTDLVERTAPAVVSIQVARAVPTGRGPMGEGMPPEFEFFRRFGPPMGPGGEPDEDPMQQGQGSGFIISADGLVLTNAHVVEGADEVTVVLADRRELKAKVVGLDETTDVAVLRVQAKGLPTLAVGDAEALKVGEWVLAIGSPFGFDHTVSAGVVSAKTRSLPRGGYVPFIQTDVALNPGNSGGPLLNLRGEVVGINSQIYSRSGGYMGLSFAIPIDLAMNIQQQLVADGKVTRGRLGVSVQSVDQALADSFGLDRPRGALVGAVEPGLAADRAGIKAGDIILSINGRTVTDSAMLSRVIAEQKPGKDVKLELLREGKQKQLSVALGAADDAQAVVADAGAGPKSEGRLGVVARALEPAQQEAAGVRSGVMVEAASGPAAKAGLRPGDIILAVNSSPVSGPGELANLIAKAPAKVALLVKREGGEIFVPVDLG